MTTGLNMNVMLCSAVCNTTKQIPLPGHRDKGGMWWMCSVPLKAPKLTGEFIYNISFWMSREISLSHSGW